MQRSERLIVQVNYDPRCIVLYFFLQETCSAWAANPYSFRSEWLMDQTLDNVTLAKAKTSSFVYSLHGRKMHGRKFLVLRTGQSHLINTIFSTSFISMQIGDAK